MSFRMTDMGRPGEEAPIVPVGHKCGESARRIRLTVHGLPADTVWYLVLVQAYLEQGRAKWDRAWCHGVVVTKGWKARTDNKWAVYRGVRELSIGDGVREYGIGRHKVYCLGGSSCTVKNEGKGRKMTGFQRHRKIVVLLDIRKNRRRQVWRIKYFYKNDVSHGRDRESIVWWPFFARGLAQRRSFVSDYCTTARRIRQVVEKWNAVVFIHVT